MLYAAAPRGIRLRHVGEYENADLFAVWNEYITTDIFESFQEALADAVEQSNDTYHAFEVVTIDDVLEVDTYYRVLASRGVLYGMLESDDIDDPATLRAIEDKYKGENYD